MELLESSDPGLSAEAFKLFSLVSEGSITHVDPDKLGVDGAIIKRGAMTNEAIASAKWDAISSKQTIQRIVKAVLEKFARESPESSLRLLDTFTMHIYEGKDLKWWFEYYPNSKLASILANEPIESWVDKPE